MAAHVGEEVIRELSSGVEVGEVAENGGPSEFLGRRVGDRAVEVEGVLEGGDGFGEVVAHQLLQLLVDRGGGGGRGRKKEGIRICGGSS